MAHDGFIQAQLRIEFLGLDYTPLAQQAALEAVTARANAHGPFAYVVAPRAAAIVALDDEPETRAHLYADAWLTLNGSRAVEALAKVTGMHLPWIDGALLARELLSRSVHSDEKICIVGGDAALVAAIAAKHKLNNVAWRAAPVGPEAVAQAVRFLVQARARYAFIACEAAEMIAEAARGSADAVGVGICLEAATLRTLGARLPRAPRWLEAAGLGWAWRPGAQCRLLRAAPGLLAIWYYWLCARFGEARASISARNAL